MWFTAQIKHVFVSLVSPAAWVSSPICWLRNTRQQDTTSVMYFVMSNWPRSSLRLRCSISAQPCSLRAAQQQTQRWTASTAGDRGSITHIQHFRLRKRQSIWWTASFPNALFYGKHVNVSKQIALWSFHGDSNGVNGQPSWLSRTVSRRG